MLQTLLGIVDWGRIEVACVTYIQATIIEVQIIGRSDLDTSLSISFVKSDRYSNSSSACAVAM
jgi:hypothetical protein